MKRIIFLVTIVVFAFSAQAQKKIQDVKEINFYGVDFSEVKTYGVMESPSQMKSALGDINLLFINEPDKYNITKFMGKRVAGYYFDDTDDNNQDTDETAMVSGSPDNPIPEEKIRQLLNGLSSERNDNVGLVFVAETLNKTGGIATFHVVFFDEATKEIIYQKKASGKSGGFGIRNFWAKSLYNILKGWRY